MKKWAGSILSLAVGASVLSAVAQDRRNVVTNEPALTVPVPRAAPRIFRDPAHNDKAAAHQHGPQCAHSATNRNEAALK